VNTQVIANAVISGAHTFLIAVGFGIIFRTTGIFHFAHAAVYTAAAYSAYVAALYSDNTALAALVGTVTAIALGALIERTIYRPLRNAGASPMAFLVVSLGVLVVLQNVISLLFGDALRSIGSVGGAAESYVILGARVTMSQVILVAASGLAALLLAVFLKISRVGITLRAVANDPDLARTLGVRVERAILVSFAIGSAFAGLAGVAWAHITALNPLMGFTALLMGVVAAIVGGIGSIRGAFAGAILVSGAQHVAMWQLPSEWQDAVVFVVLILFLLFRPYGFFGTPSPRMQA
jgi:branched-chain amino acid transport system permease protein